MKHEFWIESEGEQTFCMSGEKGEGARNGFGVAIVPELAVSTKQHLNSKVTPLTNFSSTSLGYIVRQNQVLSKATKQLLGWVNDEITSLQNK